jgi:hypothetical protein
MQKPKSLGMMNTQPLNNNYTDFKNTQNFNRLFPDRHSAISLQIGGGTYSQYSNKQKSRLTQKAKNRTASNKLFGAANNNLDNYNIRYTKYHQIYANKANAPVKAIQKKNEKFANTKISTMEEIARGRRDSKRIASGKRKTHSQQAKRPTSPKATTYYGQINDVERPKFLGKTMHQKIASATAGFDIYKAEKAYADAKPVKSKHSKSVTSKKQARIR